MTTTFTPDDDRRLAEWLGIPAVNPLFRPFGGGNIVVDIQIVPYLTAPTAESDYRVLEVIRNNYDKWMAISSKLGLGDDAAHLLMFYKPGDYARAAFAVMGESQ